MAKNYKEHSKNKKKIVLLMHNGGRLGNQMWLMACLYAYSLEKNYVFDVRPFFEYQEYFNIKIHSFFSRWLGKIYYLLIHNIKIDEDILRDLFYGIYTFYTELFAFFNSKCIVYDTMHKRQVTFRIFLYKRYKTFLRFISNIIRNVTKRKKEYQVSHFEKTSPPLTLLPPTVQEQMPSDCSSLYFYGWHFRNPVGLLKYREQIKDFFTPKQSIVTKVQQQIDDSRDAFQTVIGVHVRLGDVVNEFMDNDRIAYSEAEVYKILKEYMAFSKNDPEKTLFLICSDGKIDPKVFVGLNVKITQNDHIEDLWLLSKTDTIIGADSSFAIMSSLLGNKPFIVFQRGIIDWGYYRDKKEFFQNKFVKRFIY